MPLVAGGLAARRRPPPTCVCPAINRARMLSKQNRKPTEVSSLEEADMKMAYSYTGRNSFRSSNALMLRPVQSAYRSLGPRSLIT